MKVAIVTIGGYQSFGGPAKSVKAFQKALNAEVVVWADPMAFPGESLVFPDAALVRPVRMPGLRHLAYPNRSDLARAAERVADSDFISCHLFWRWHVSWVAWLARRRDIPFWFVPHGGLDPYVFSRGAAAKQAFIKTVGAEFLAHASGVVCSTRREYQKASHHLPHATPYILPWPLEADDIRDRNIGAREAIRSDFGIPAEATCLLYLGRLHPMKRPLETISALAESDSPQVHLIVVGNEDGLTAQAVAAHAKVKGVAGQVHIAGPAFGARKQAFFDAADVFVSLSHRENFNLAAAEAMGSGLPVLLSPGNDLSADLADVGCGWMLPSLAAAATTIQEISQMPSTQLERMGARGKAWAAERLSFRAFEQRLRNYVADAAKKNVP